MRIGIYGGTFDPIHFGHLNLALEIAETRSLDQVWFCPAWRNPFKTDLKVTSAEDRLEMLKLALSDIPQFQILEDEILREGSSYTIDTLRALISREKGKTNPNQYFLIIGDDAILRFPQWKEAEEIIKLVPVFIGRRSLSDIDIDLQGLQASDEMKYCLQKGMTNTHVMDISATMIRKRLAAGQYCGHLIPAKALLYVKKKRLFKNNLV